ncbi:hypothetical protein V5799_032665 [Amblyomma americanum]|uniref:Uncharacterized protein n=1 Tax=Amblyomma americanum TaxID=6943 RepID=A0AAQ4DQJ1_AMBAM
MHAGSESNMEASSAELSSVRDGRSSSAQDGPSVRTTSSNPEASADVEEPPSLDSSAGGEWSRRSSVRLMFAATLGIFGLAATLVIVFRMLQAGSLALQGDGEIAGLDDVTGDEDVVVGIEVKTDEPALPQLKGLTRSWWFSNGTDCEEWRFPFGLCPARGSSVFKSARQCHENCLRPRDKLECCHRPEPHVCTLGQLKYPYFAVAGFDGCFRCLEASARHPVGLPVPDRSQPVRIGRQLQQHLCRRRSSVKRAAFVLLNVDTNKAHLSSDLRILGAERVKI